MVRITYILLCCYGLLLTICISSNVFAGSGRLDSEEFEKAGSAYFRTHPPEIDTPDYVKQRALLSDINGAYLKSQYENPATYEKIVAKAFPRFIKVLAPLEAVFVGDDLRMFYFITLNLYRETKKYRRGLQALEKLYASSPMSRLYYLYSKSMLSFYAYLNGEIDPGNLRIRSLGKMLTQLEMNKQAAQTLAQSQRAHKWGKPVTVHHDLKQQQKRADRLVKRLNILESLDSGCSLDRLLYSLVKEAVGLIQDVSYGSPLPVKGLDEKCTILIEALTYLTMKAHLERGTLPAVKKEKSKVHINFAPSVGGRFAEQIFYDTLSTNLRNPLQSIVAKMLNVFTYSLGMEELFDYLNAAGLISSKYPLKYVQPCGLWKLSVNENFGLLFRWANNTWESVSFSYNGWRKVRKRNANTV